MTIANNVVDEANLKVSNGPTNGYVLSAQSGNTGGLTWAEAGGGSRVLLNRSVMNNTSSYVFTATDATKYDSYYIDFNGLVTSASYGYLHMYFSDDGGSTYESSVVGVSQQLRNTTQSTHLNNGLMQMAYAVDPLSGSFGANVCGHVRLMNPHGGNTVSFGALGMSSYRGLGPSAPSILTFGAQSKFEDYSQDGWIDINAFKIQWSSGNIVKGTISVFGVLK